MDAVVVFEDADYRNLLPLVYWRATCQLRVGKRTLLSKVRRQFEGVPVSVYVRDELAEITRQRHSIAVNEPPSGDRVLFVNGRAAWRRRVEPDRWPSAAFAGESLLWLAADRALADRLGSGSFFDAEALAEALGGVPRVEPDPDACVLFDYPWQLVGANHDELLLDWQAEGAGGIEGAVHDGCHLLNEADIHVGPGSTIKPCCVLDAEDGPVWIGENCRIGPHATLEGPCCIGDGSVIQPGARIREDATIGPVCKVGGEIEASVIHSYSNKQHDGFLGHAYLGSWINIAADCVNSDLKNTYGTVRVPINGVEIETGEMFVGLTMGDHTKAGINLSFPTGAVAGFASNIFLSTFPPKFVGSFNWYTDRGCMPYDPHRGVATARRVMQRRKVEMTAAEEALFLATAEMARHIEVAWEVGPGE